MLGVEAGGAASPVVKKGCVSKTKDGGGAREGERTAGDGGGEAALDDGRDGGPAGGGDGRALEEHGGGNGGWEMEILKVGIRVEVRNGGTEISGWCLRCQGGNISGDVLSCDVLIM